MLRKQTSAFFIWLNKWWRYLELRRYFPFGIVFLVAGKILDMHDPAHLGEKLGMYFITVLSGLFVHGLILLPLFFYLFTRKNPFPYIRGLLQALVIALATSSRYERSALRSRRRRPSDVCLNLRPILLPQLSDVAHHHEVSPGELRCGPADCPLCAPSRSHHQHGRHSPVRGRGGHLYSSGQRVWFGLRPAGHH